MKRLFGWMVLLVAVGCTDPYHLPPAATANSALVVDGVVYAAGDSSVIRLTRSKDFSDTSQIPVETGAHMVLEAASGGPSYVFADTGNGYYTLPPLALDQSLSYRLNITLSNGRQYLSDYVPVVPTPPIDSITYVREPGNGLTIYANTHDPAAKTHYYQWTYVETYEYHSWFFSSIRYVPVDSVTERDTPIQVCYLSIPSSDILIGSSAALSSDLIAQAPLEVIPEYSVKLGVEYSTLVTQTALTKDAFTYWQNMKTNSEELGSIFGPQPFQVNGNVHSATNPDETVIGYLSVTTAQRRRIFITGAKINWQLPPTECMLDTANTVFPVPPRKLSSWASDPNFILIGVYRPGIYLGTYGGCGDCRFDGGALAKPSFWP